MGGVHATVLPDEALQHVDAVLLGEEEAVWPAFFADLRQGKLQQKYQSDQLINMEEIPLPRYDLTRLEKYQMIHIQASRGCPMGCDFCENVLLHGLKMRHKTPAQVVREIEYIKTLSEHLPPLFLFSDANMFVDKEYSHQLMAAMEPLGIRWSCYSDISIAAEDELLQKIANAGCYEMVIGLESLNEKNLDVISHWKSKRLKDYESSIAKIQSYGIGVSGSFIIGYDEDTLETFESLKQFILANNLYEVSISVLTPLPGTSVYYRLKEEGRIISDDWEDYTTWSVVFQPKNMTPEQLVTKLGDVYAQVFSKERILKRAKHFKQLIRNRL
jgi:radical SAM superfamily enzyme YgiQ (UPF0313 family)